MLHFLGDKLLSERLQLADVPSAIHGNLGELTQGLYVFRFSNDTDFDVFDRNKRPKVVVYRRGGSIKAGKFEQGFARRLGSFNAHLHWPNAGGELKWALQVCYREGYVLNLSKAAEALQKPARIFERYWTESIGIFLREHELLAGPPIRQISQAEWRYLQLGAWTADVARNFAVYLEGVSARIFEMAEVGRLPSPRGLNATLP